MGEPLVRLGCKLVGMLLEMVYTFVCDCRGNGVAVGVVFSALGAKTRLEDTADVLEVLDCFRARGP